MVLIINIVKFIKYIMFCIKIEYLVITGLLSDNKANDFAKNYLKDNL